MRTLGTTSRQILWIGAVAAAYYVAGGVGHLFSFADNGVSPVCPASGLALASMLLLGVWVWPGVLIGEFLSSYSESPSALVALGVAIGSTTGGPVCVFLLDRFIGFDRKIGRIRDAVVLFLVAAPVYATCTATIAITSMYLGGSFNLNAYPGEWLTWWMGDATGIMVLVPFLLAWSVSPKFKPRQVIEIALLNMALGLLAWFIFQNNFSFANYTINFPYTYILFPFTLWAALRFGIRGASLAVLLISVNAVLGTVQGFGPFARNDTLSDLILLDSFIVVLASTTLLLVAVINERLQMEEERDRFFSLSLDMMCIANVDGYFKKVSPAFEETLGWSIKEMTSRPFISFVHPDDVEATLAEVDKQIIEGKKVLQFENRYRHKDGSWRVLSWKSVPQGNELYGTARDVTESNKIKTALQESEERFRTMANSIPQLAWMANPDGEIYWYNQQWYDFTGTTEKESFGMGWQQILRPEDLPKILKRLKEPIDKSEPWEDLSQLRRYDGVYRWHLMQMRAVKDKKGHVFQWLGTSTDITETKEAEEKIRQSARKFKVVLNSILEAVLTTDTEGRVNIMNPVAEKLTGWNHERAHGRPIDEVFKLINQQTREVMTVPIADILRTGLKKGMSNHKLLIARDATERNVAYSASPISLSATEMLGVVIVFRDVTEERAIAQGREEIERHRAESDKIAREAAESASRAKSAFVASMSHEIRTPMNAILGFAQILQRDTTLTPQQSANVATINRAGIHLLALIDDILEISKIEAGRVLLFPFVFSLHELLDDLEMMFRSRCEAKGLQLLLERDESVPQYVEADEAKLRQVFINLLVNAVKFTEQGGIAMRVRCDTSPSTENTSLPESDKGNVRLLVEIEDTGMGIAQEDIGKLFRNFEQTSAGAKAGGTGLGLSISKKLAQMMGGDISVRSEIGKGSCFRFDVMLKTAEAAVLPERPAQKKVIGLKPVASPIRALIVDDNKDNRALLKALLEPLGIALCEATNGREALAVIDSFNPTVILMDMRMPDMDGYEATRQIRATKAGSKVPIIAVTASAFDDAEAQVLRAGVDAYIRKPFRNEHLFETLGRLLDLQYEYAEEESETKQPKLTVEQLKQLPEELLSALRKALGDGDMGQLSEVIKKVGEVDGDMARQLQALAENFDYEGLGRLLK